MAALLMKATLPAGPIGAVTRLVEASPGAKLRSELPVQAVPPGYTAAKPSAAASVAVTLRTTAVAVAATPYCIATGSSWAVLAVKRCSGPTVWYGDPRVSTTRCTATATRCPAGIRSRTSREPRPVAVSKPGAAGQPVGPAVQARMSLKPCGAQP